MFEDIRIQRRPSVTQVLPSTSGIASAIRGASVLRGGATPALPTARAPMGSRAVAARPSVTRILPPTGPIASSIRGGGVPTARVSAGMGGVVRPLPTGRSVVSPVAGDSTGILPPSTLATQGAFGGETGGMGAAAAAAPTALGPETLSGIGSSLSKMGTGIMNTITSLVPLAIKVILAVIVIKIVIWLLRGRR